MDPLGVQGRLAHLQDASAIDDSKRKRPEDSGFGPEGIVQNEMEKAMESKVETGMIWGFRV